ncbi:MAG: dihydrofolate reductase family protein [Rhizobacter sp.]|nr:dihydrofolate reductase family protein [Rhizobacter sp.]
MQMSVDGFMAADDASLDWTLWDWGPDCPWDEALVRRFNDTIAGIDTVLLSGPMAAGDYIDHWTRMAAKRGGEPAYAFTQHIVAAHKRVLSQSLREVHHPRTSLGRGALATEVAGLKRAPGRDIICFGGVGFAGALLEAGLVDEVQLYVNPVVLGAGRSIFGQARRWRLIDATAHGCGIVVQRYRP